MAENVELNILGKIDLSNVINSLNKAQDTIEKFKESTGGILEGGIITVKSDKPIGKPSSGILDALAPLAIIAGGITLLVRSSAMLGSVLKSYVRLFMMIMKPMGDILASFLRPLFFLIKPFLDFWKQTMLPIKQFLMGLTMEFSKLFGTGGQFEEIGKILGMIIGGTATLMGVLIIIGAIMKVFGFLGGVITPIIAVIKAVGGAILTLSTGALLPIIAVIAIVIAVIAGFIAAFQENFLNIQKTVKMFLEGLVITFEGIFTFLEGVWNLIVALFTGNGQLLIQAVQQIFGGIINIVFGLLQSLGSFIVILSTSILRVLWGVLYAIGQAVVIGIGWVANAISSTFKGVVNFVIGIINSLIRSIPFIGESLPLIPFVQKGGYIAKTGVAVVHKGETVIPAGGQNTMNINISGADSELKMMIERTVESYMRTQYTNY